MQEMKKNPQWKQLNMTNADHTCHQLGPGMVNWKKFRALQTIERVFPGAIGTLKEHIHMTHFWSPTTGSFVSISIL